jgi:hypothetical protein
MRLGRTIVAGVVSGLLAGCAADIRSINARPDAHYQETVTLKGRVARLQRFPGEVLFELADPQEHRILVRAPEPFEFKTGDWVRVRGILVPEARVADGVAFDVIVADRIRSSRPPRFPNLM